MDNEWFTKYCSNFPTTLQTKLLNEEIHFPDETKYDYEPILAYRGIKREQDDDTPVNYNDMLSYYEQGKVPRGVLHTGNSINDPLYYAISLFDNFDMLKQCFKFPRKNQKVAVGYVYKEGGPQCRSRDGHISWWLFENVSFDGFEIRSDINE